jgi:hypothetical protein
MNEPQSQTLSPAAQEVLTAAICDGPELEYRIAAALRAVAEVNIGTDYQNGKRVHTILRSDILAIAAELEGSL